MIDLGFRGIDQQKIDNLMSEIDQNNDGEVQWGEFLILVTNLCKPSA